MIRLPRQDEFRCPDDATTMLIYQPDEKRPARMLACCPHCHEWFQLVEDGRPAAWRIAGLVPKPQLLHQAG